MSRRCPALATLALTALAAAVPAQESARDRPGATGKDVSSVGRQQEAAALKFVREHHRDLADLLTPLRTMDRDAYDAAIRELDRTRENLERLERRDPDRAALSLACWKAGSHVELLTARLISRPDPKLEVELRQALADQLSAQLTLQKYDRDQLQRRLEQMDETIRRLERRGDAQIESRFNAALKKVQRVRRQAGDGEPAGPAGPPARTARPEGGES